MDRPTGLDAHISCIDTVAADWVMRVRVRLSTLMRLGLCLSVAIAPLARTVQGATVIGRLVASACGADLVSTG